MRRIVSEERRLSCLPALSSYLPCPNPGACQVPSPPVCLPIVSSHHSRSPRPSSSHAVPATPELSHPIFVPFPFVTESGVWCLLLSIYFTYFYIIIIPPLQRSGWYIVFALCVRPCVRASEQFPEHISHVFSHIVMKLSIRVLVWKAVCHVP